ncbi:MAG: class III signal peptide-containing protein [Candidatus ainarchaeum sp.]|nr:class III signal peptide-containing protein [Candidatus ainarchaeum sp.]
MFLKEEKAQGSLEYLLLIGGAVIVAAVVGLYLKTSANAIRP